MVCPESMLEAAVGRARINQERMADLAYVAEALDRRRVQRRESRGIYANIVPERVADDLGGGRWSGSR
jgi:hypothetical protein